MLWSAFQESNGGPWDGAPQRFQSGPRGVRIQDRAFQQLNMALRGLVPQDRTLLRAQESPLWPFGSRIGPSWELNMGPSGVWLEDGAFQGFHR